MSKLLYLRDASGEYRLAQNHEVIACAQRCLNRSFRAGSPVFTSPARTREFLTVRLGALEHELFTMLALDNRHRLIEYVELFRGTVDSASVHPREVVKELLARNAAAAIFAHNHPSGTAEPSQADELITRRLREALALVDIRVLDHLVIGGNDVISFAERGLL